MSAQTNTDCVIDCAVLDVKNALSDERDAHEAAMAELKAVVENQAAIIGDLRNRLDNATGHEGCDSEIRDLLNSLDDAREETEAAEAKLAKVIASVTAVYYAAKWSADRPVDEATLWTTLRDACGFVPGNAPAEPKKCVLCGGEIGPDFTGRPMCYGCGPSQTKHWTRRDSDAERLVKLIPFAPAEPQPEKCVHVSRSFNNESCLECGHKFPPAEWVRQDRHAPADAERREECCTHQDTAYRVGLENDALRARVKELESENVILDADSDALHRVVEERDAANALLRKAVESTGGQVDLMTDIRKHLGEVEG